MSVPPVIVGIGEVLWDVYPDAAHFGGAPANFASHAASLGAKARMVSAVGTDEFGDGALESLRLRGVECASVKRDPIHPTGQVLVSLDTAGQPTYEFAADTAWDHLTWSNDLESLARQSDAVCFGTLGQRSPSSRDSIRQFVKTTPAEALRVFDVNLRQRFYDAETIESSLQIASAVKLNEDELPIVAEFCGINGSTPRQMLRELVRRYELRLAALTRGPGGALLISPAEESERPAVPAVVVDTVGAGDAFTATLVFDFLGGLPLGAINAHANAVASFICSQPGATAQIPHNLLQLT